MQRWLIGPSGARGGVERGHAWCGKNETTFASRQSHVEDQAKQVVVACGCGMIPGRLKPAWRRSEPSRDESQRWWGRSLTRACDRLLTSARRADLGPDPNSSGLVWLGGIRPN
jgi:hypothetical protein